MPAQRVDLVNLFQSVTQALAENQQTLDQADDYNHNHGSNMVQTFQTITNALEQKQGSSDSAALNYAARKLARQANSGSSQLYAQHLSQAATQFKRKKVDEKGALDLLQTLIGAAQGSGGQAAGVPPSAPTSGGGDLLGALLGGLAGGAPTQPASQSGGGDLLGSLLGGLGSSTGSSGDAQQGGLNLQNLLQAGMAYMQAFQGGASTMQALAQAFVAGSGMGNSSHRTQSTQVVVNSFLQALSGMARKD